MVRSKCSSPEMTRAEKVMCLLTETTRILKEYQSRKRDYNAVCFPLSVEYAAYDGSVRMYPRSVELIHSCSGRSVTIGGAVYTDHESFVTPGFAVQYTINVGDDGEIKDSCATATVGGKEVPFTGEQGDNHDRMVDVWSGVINLAGLEYNMLDEFPGDVAPMIES